jgi:hypothetical protein
MYCKVKSGVAGALKLATGKIETIIGAISIANL